MPTLYCSVRECKLNSTHSNVKFFHYPNDEIIRQQWILYANRSDDWSPGNSSRVCSVHFSLNCMNPRTGRLCHGAIPGDLIIIVTSISTYYTELVHSKIIKA